MGDQFSGKIWDLLSRVGYDNPCMSFVHICILLLVVFLVLCIFVVSGITDVYICHFLVDWVKLCFRFLC